MYLHVLVSAVVVGWLSGVALAASGEGLRTEFGGTYANNTPTVGQTLRSDGTGYVPQDMTGITECPLAWDATANQFKCRDVDNGQLTETYCQQDKTKDTLVTSLANAVTVDVKSGMQESFGTLRVKK